MTTRSAFHTLVSNEINRETIFDTVIPNYVQRALRFLERNYTFEYMKSISNLTIVEDVRTYSVTGFTSSEIKRINFWRMFATDAVSDSVFAKYIKKVDPQEVTQTANETPTDFYMNGISNLVTVQTPAGTVTDAEIGWTEYTSTTTDYTTEPWLITNAEDVMIAQTMLMMRGRLRLNQERVQAYKDMRDEGIRTLVRSENEHTQGAQEQEMAYG